MCRLCDGNFDFRKVAIKESAYAGGLAEVVFNGNLMDSNEGNRFKFCPECGCKLDRRRFTGGAKA